MFVQQNAETVDDLRDPNEETVEMERNAARFAVFYTQKHKQPGLREKVKHEADIEQVKKAVERFS